MTHRVHVLIVDDEQHVCELLGEFLSGKGHSVLSAGSAAEALALTGLRKTEVALIDIHLKGKLTGHDLIAKFNEIMPDAAMILMSGRGEIDDLVTAFEQHVFTFLSKPFKSLNEIDLLVRRAAQARQNEITAREYTRTLETAKSDLERIVSERTFQLERMRKIVSHLFSVSSRLGMIEPLDSLLNYVCQSIVDAGAFRRAAILLADEKFMVRHIGYANSASEPDLLQEQIRSRRDQPLRPFDFSREETRIGSGFLAKSTSEGRDSGSPDEDIWKPGDQLIVPLRRKEGTIFGYLTVDDPQDGSSPSEEIIQYLDVLLSHSSLHVEAQQIRQVLRARAEDLERRVQERTTELRQSQEKFSRLVNLTTDIVYISDADGKVVYLNDAFVGSLGYVRENYIGHTLASMMEELVTDDPANHSEIEQLVGKEDSHSLHRIEILTRQGDKRSFEINRTVIRQGGEFKGTQGIARDVTEHRALLKRVMSSERLAATGRLAAGIAHEINNPLQAITSHLNAARDQAGSGEHLDVIEEGIERIRTIVRGMLDLHRTQSAVTVDLDLNTLIERVLALTTKQLRGSGIEIETQFKRPLPPIKGSPSDLQQVILNLILNASDAMPDGGLLTVVTEATEQDVRIRIVDTGVGIPEEHRKKIFEPFFSSRQGGGGVGLGLYLCKNTIEIHQGTIEVDSAPDKGTTFTIILPQA